ncbi:sigma-54 dependent transcriptional regulator [Clostridium sporogenes]|nr:sigma-54 dependent transcriptional regulator [Clostridium sporogenes]
MVNYDNNMCLEDLFSHENGEKFLSISVLQTAFNVAYEGLILIDKIITY